MCHRMYEYAPGDSNDDQNQDEEHTLHQLDIFLNRCPQLKLFLSEHKLGEPERELIEKELMTAEICLNIDMKMIDALEAKQFLKVELTPTESESLILAKEDQLAMQKKIGWLGVVLTEYDSYIDFAKTLETKEEKEEEN